LEAKKMNKHRKKILLAVDGSEHALEAVRYVSKMPPFRELEVVLFNVHSPIPEAYWDLGNKASFGWAIHDVRAWEMVHDKTLQEYLEKAKKILWRAGFPKDAVTVKIKKREKDVARDIAREAVRGYSCVVVGRKGMSKFKDLVLGSVSTKLVEKLSLIPLVVVGEKPKQGAVLLAMDGSETAMRAVDQMGALLGASDLEVALIHVIRGDNSRYLEKAKEATGKAFDEAKGRLTKAGFEPYQITTKTMTGALSRAGALVAEAKEGGFGTIVIGKRGLSSVEEFFMGRVSNKVLHLAKEMAVWVVG
jgi:nucleotide-binding universal stress UspA family protein